MNARKKFSCQEWTHYTTISQHVMKFHDADEQRQFVQTLLDTQAHPPKYPMIVNKIFMNFVSPYVYNIFKRIWQVRLMIFVKRQIVMFWNRCCYLEGLSKSLSPKQIPLQHWCNKVNTFWPPYFHSSSYSKDFISLLSTPIYLSLTPSTVAWLKQLHLYMISSLVISFSDFPPFPLRCEYATSNYLKSGQAEAQLPSHNLYTLHGGLFLNLVRWRFFHQTLVPHCSFTARMTNDPCQRRTPGQLKGPCVDMGTVSLGGKRTRPSTTFKISPANSNLTHRAPSPVLKLLTLNRHAYKLLKNIILGTSKMGWHCSTYIYNLKVPPTNCI